ncbi:MAG: endonuclease III [Chloroflexi bacterium]|nr:endonuclease III [Chloroflexota bacterium]MCI0576604.1 endonuclease III [Chloroflexota bacterium]MCI0647028.1 endonuclease III [Chloroflexota bacterium]MCI0730728.1 endonuclease III [Chloroflexota bacterium]
MDDEPQPSHSTALSPDTPAAGRIGDIIHRLRQAHPDARCALNHENPLQLLVATILSAQCTDERVNMVTPVLFARYPTAADLATAEREELEEIIRSTGFYRQKARFVQETCQILVRQHGGEVPADMVALLALKGVARKTANVVLGVAFGLAEGIVVDTHVKRLSGRLGLTAESDPEKIERDLMVLVPRQEWISIAHLLIFHGRRVCHARKPDCAHCTLYDLCPSALPVERGEIGD